MKFILLVTFLISASAYSAGARPESPNGRVYDMLMEFVNSDMARDEVLKLEEKEEVQCTKYSMSADNSDFISVTYFCEGSSNIKLKIKGTVENAKSPYRFSLRGVKVKSL